MTQSQYDILAARLIRSPQQRQAVAAYLFDGMTAYGAEVKYRGEETNTVSRDAKRVQAQFLFCLEVVNA